MTWFQRTHFLCQQFTTFTNLKNLDFELGIYINHFVQVHQVVQR